MSDKPHDHWLNIRSQGRDLCGSDVPTVSSRTDTGFGPVRFALSNFGAPRLLVPIPHTGALMDIRSLSGPGLEVAIARYDHEGRSSLYLDITLRELRLDQLFGDLCCEILSRIDSGSPPTTAVRGTIEDFRSLLAEKPRPPQDASTVLGLLGELLVLRDGAKRSPLAIDAWTGPEGQRHDYRSRTGALEVKTTCGKNSTKIHIHGLDQLYPPSDAPLWLAHVILERTQNGLVRLDALYSELIELGVHAGSLRAKLSALGCDDPYSIEWNWLAASLEGFNLYFVDSAFPRLSPMSLTDQALPPGIGDVEYTVDLSVAGASLVPDMQHDLVFKAVFE